jgi:hypothetical protein
MTKHYKDLFQYGLAALLVIAILTLVCVVFFVELPSGNKEVALLIIGALVAKFSDVIAYFFNSTKGSAEKNELLYNATPTNVEGKL